MLLRRLARLLPQCTFRAYADDLAAVVPSLSDALPVLVPLFHEFALLSGLELNVGKTVLVPLAPGEPADLAGHIARQSPAWAGIAVRRRARYLGFMLGMDKGDSSFDQALTKSRRRRGAGAAQVPGWHSRASPTRSTCCRY